MAQSIAVAVIHGAGIQKEDFAEILIENLQKHIQTRMRRSGLPFTSKEFVFQPVHWGVVFNDKERELWEDVQKGGPLNFTRLRKFFIEFLGDAIAYQPTMRRHQNYERVHEVYSHALKELSQKAGKDAPLTIIGHSLGTVITSNFFYDLQERPQQTDYLTEMLENASSIEKGETFAQFISLGSPLALWSLRYASFDRPIQVPAPQFNTIYPTGKGSWINLYDRDDILGYPLRTLSKAYEQAVEEDREMNVGNLLKNWNPASHFEYVKDKDILDLITEKLIRLWLSVNDSNPEF
ncbi:chemotaxis protein [Alkalihalobacillus sp. AL-G]|uniref:chemotaxis protein n=1 Tax=Alkalihalobacillus sp. AL-G TaxID=2926399 RepID=UPI00272A0EE8|nr:chemotaxis protein [Alkalihalobacillus sp. AL-G]WLD91566.1 chemotaxis protein [Alkalihalobacillus sp. AL-G]